MDKWKHEFWIIGGIVFVIVGLLVSVFGLLPQQSGDHYIDPLGRLTMQDGFGCTALRLNHGQRNNLQTSVDINNIPDDGLMSF